MNSNHDAKAATQSSWRTWPHSLAEARVHGAALPVRVGGLFVASVLTAMLMGVLVERGSIGPMPITNSIAWTTVAAVSALCGVASIASLRTMGVIERQLQTAAATGCKQHLDTSECDSHGNSNHAVTPTIWSRPIIGAEAAALGYNRLLEAAMRCSAPIAERATSQLDDAAITQARAMRVLPTAWVVTDQAGVVRHSSPHAHGLLAQTNMEGRSLFRLLQLESDPSSEEDVAPVVANQKLLDIERCLSRVRLVTLKADVQVADQTIHLDVSRSRLRGRDGDCEGLVWLLEDRTAQHAAVRSRDEFLLTATHELRTPLTNLRALAETLRDERDVDIEQQKEFCNVIVSESVRLSRLVDHLLSMGQIEAGSLVIEQRELDLQSLLRDVEHQVRGQADEKNIQVQCDVSAKLPTVMGDRDKLQAALINLTGNAVKYTPSGGEVTLRCRQQAAQQLNSETDDTNLVAHDVSQDLVCIDIIDNGPGISPADQAHVFDKFFRCDHTAQACQGNGLGLSLALEVARLHGGDIQLESTLGEGSRFTLSLPATGLARSGVSNGVG